MKLPESEYEEFRCTFAKHGEADQLHLVDSLAPSDTLAMATLVAMWRTETKPSILRWVARALCSFDSSQANKCLVEALNHPNMSVRLHAVSGLHRTKRKDMLAFILPLVKDSSSAVRLRALGALVDLQAEGVEPLLEGALGDTKDYVRNYAHTALSARARRPSNSSAA